METSAEDSVLQGNLKEESPNMEQGNLSRTLVALALAAAFVCAPAFAYKKSKAEPDPTQPDVTTGCVTIHNIAVTKSVKAQIVLAFFGSGGTLPVSVQGTIVNSCGHEVTVNAGISFYDRDGNWVDGQNAIILVRPGEKHFIRTSIRLTVDTGRLDSLLLN